MKRLISSWIWIAPVAAAICLVLGAVASVPAIVLGTVLVAVVLASVHHAELIAHRVGEPYGSFLLALAVTVIDVGLIVTLMLQGGEGSATLASDTVFAAVMIILNGLVGACILIGALRHHEQTFQQSGVSASLATLSTLTVLTLVLPSFAVSAQGAYYAPSQLAFVAVVSLLLYLTFVSVQTVRHRDYFLPPQTDDEDAHAEPPSARLASISAVAAGRLPGRSRAAGQGAGAGDPTGGRRRRRAPGHRRRADRRRWCCCPKALPRYARRWLTGCRRASTWRWARRSHRSA